MDIPWQKLKIDHPPRNTNMSNITTRQRLLAALAKPIPEDSEMADCIDYFNPWNDVIQGISGSYASGSNIFMVDLLEAVRDNIPHKTNTDLMKKHGLAADMGLFILAGHGLTEYGGSPYGGWPDFDIADLWQPLIDHWKAYNLAVWNIDPETGYLQQPHTKQARLEKGELDKQTPAIASANRSGPRL